MEGLGGLSFGCVSGFVFVAALCAWLTMRRRGWFSASMVPGTIMLPVGVLLTGWSAQYKVHWIVPDIVSTNVTLACR
jgi:hypothetical protein